LPKLVILYSEIHSKKDECCDMFQIFTVVVVQVTVVCWVSTPCCDCFSI